MGSSRIKKSLSLVMGRAIDELAKLIEKEANDMAEQLFRAKVSSLLNHKGVGGVASTTRRRITKKFVDSARAMSTEDFLSDKTLSELGLVEDDSRRWGAIRRGLKNIVAGLKKKGKDSVKDFSSVTENELGNFRFVGDDALSVLSQALKKIGLVLKQVP